MTWHILIGQTDNPGWKSAQTLPHLYYTNEEYSAVCFFRSVCPCLSLLGIRFDSEICSVVSWEFSIIGEWMNTLGYHSKEQKKEKVQKNRRKDSDMCKNRHFNYTRRMKQQISMPADLKIMNHVIKLDKPNSSTNCMIPSQLRAIGWTMRRSTCTEFEELASVLGFRRVHQNWIWHQIQLHSGPYPGAMKEPTPPYFG